MAEPTASSTSSSSTKAPQDADDKSDRRGKQGFVGRWLGRGKGTEEWSTSTAGGVGQSETGAVSETQPATKEAKDEPKIATREFGFLPVPRYLRHDPAKPFELSLAYCWLFGVGAMITVSNIYYSNPILAALAVHFDVPYGTVTRAASLIQAGYLCGLLLISPLGDLVPRRPLLLTLIAITATLSIGLALAPSFAAYEAIQFLVGFCNVSPQILIPLTADLAHSSRRAASVSIVLAGLVGGMVWGRLLSGILNRFTGSPLNVYFLSAGVQYALLVVFYFTLPSFPRKETGLQYLGILRSMVRLFFTEPTLFQACWIGMLSCAIMVNWWTSLTFLLTDAPFSYDTFRIGLFSLTGIFTIAWAPWAGKLVDRLLPWLVTLIALSGHVIFQSIATGGAGKSLGPVIIGCIMIDVCHQTLTISQQARFFAIDPKARARVNACYMSFVFAGQAIGSSAGPHLFLMQGWRACYALSVGWAGLAIVILLLKGPHSGRQWFGWAGNYSLRRPPPTPAVAAKVEAEKSGDVDVEAQRAEGFLQSEAEKSQEQTVVEPELESGQVTPKRREKGKEGLEVV